MQCRILNPPCCAGTKIKTAEAHSNIGKSWEHKSIKFPSRSEDPKDKPSAIYHVFQTMMKDLLFTTVLTVHQVCDGLKVTLISNPCKKCACMRRIYGFWRYPITVISFKLDGLILGCGRNSAELMHCVLKSGDIVGKLSTWHEGLNTFAFSA